MSTSQARRFLVGTVVPLAFIAAASPSFAASESRAVESATSAPTRADVAPPAPIDQTIADRLRDLAAGKLGRIFGSEKERAAVDAFYGARDHAPLWVTSGAANGRAQTAIAYLKAVEADGLDPADYPTPDFKAAAEPGALAEAELKLTASVLSYARHAQVGRVHFSRISRDIYYIPVVPQPADILAKLASAQDVAAALDSYQPQHADYKTLKAKLAEMRNSAKVAEIVRIPEGPTMRLGVDDPRVPILRKRLNISGDQTGTKYDESIAGSIKSFQKDAGLKPDGLLGPNTLRALNGPNRAEQIDIILANMERWRWLPRDLGDVYVMLNIPDFTLKVVNRGVTVWTTKVVVGKPSTPTPILSDTMKSITVNPTWNVPPSIVYNEYLPALRQDPRALERIGLKLIRNRDGSVHIYQPPGERNALGRLRFNFPNRFLVYQHDTPDKHLFARDKRAYSHGCMRVQDPVRYAELLLSIVMLDAGYTQERIRKMFGGAERNIQLPTPIPVHITYQTAYVDEAGKLVIREDIYGRDTRMLATLKGNERRLADVASERPRPNSRRPPVRLPDGSAAAGRSGPSFFERLFGAAPAVPRASMNGRRVLAR